MSLLNPTVGDESPADIARIVAASQAAIKASKEKFSVSPFRTHREIILSSYSTALRMQDLVLHLWNDNRPVQLGSLLGNADQKHTQIVLAMIESYSVWGENDPDFMALAEEILSRRTQA